MLDDGRRPSVRLLADRLGCHYLTRADNHGAKAGNLNAALEVTQGEFVVVLDADTVPQPDLIERTLGYFTDEKVAFVQLPQEFYNTDSIQHAAGRRRGLPWHEQSLFYRVIQRGKQRWNAAFWCGSPSVLRRTALEDVGGVATSSITEDIHTSLRMHARGWKSVFHAEPLAFGIAPESYGQFETQRLRWAQGTMQILRSRENPLWIPGLTVAQRLNYLGSMVTYFDAFAKLLFLLIPTVILVTGMLPVDANLSSFLLRWAPYYLLTMAANVALGRGQFHYLYTEEFNFLKMFMFIRASAILATGQRLKFKVTPKQTDHSENAADRRALRMHFGLLAVILVSVVAGGVNVVWGLTAEFSNGQAGAAALFWALCNALLVLIGVKAVLGRVYHRKATRFEVRLRGEVTAQDSGRRVAVVVNDISMGGAALGCRQPLQQGELRRLEFRLPDGPISLRGTTSHARATEAGNWEAGLAFGELDDRTRQRLQMFLFVSLPRDGALGGSPAGDIVAA